MALKPWRNWQDYKHNAGPYARLFFKGIEMGGNAMAPFGARRYSRQEYLEARREIGQLLKQYFPLRDFLEIPSYHNKESFGDMDLLTVTLQPEEYEGIQFALKSKHSERNSEVMSLLYKELQVDIIPMPRDDLQSAYMYYAYNEKGNLMGKIFHKFGVKYGHRGLTMPMKDGDNMFHEVLISKDGDKIFSFLGLSYKRWQAGFDELEDIFKFVTSSPFFSAEIFQYENLNHTNRIRDRKRSTYRGFLEYIKGMDNEYGFPFNENKDVYLPLLFAHFPGMEKQYEEGRAKLAHRLAVKAHFNGNMVSEWTGLKGEELGTFMQWVREGNGDFHKWVLRHTQDQLKRIVAEELASFQNARAAVKAAKEKGVTND